MVKPLIVLLTTPDAPIHEDAVNMLKKIGQVKYAWTKGWRVDEEVLANVKDANAILVRIGRVNKDVMDQCPDLKIIAVHGVGVDRVDVEEATRRGIIVTNVPGGNAEAVAELTVCLIIMLLRKLHLILDRMKYGKWFEARKYIPGMEINNKVVGIIGLGNIGSRVARYLKTMNAKVIAYDPYVPNSVAKELNIKLVDDLKELLQEADIITIHVPLTKETYHMIDEEKLRIMKPTAIIVNTSRGAVIDSKALLKALREGWISGAALDVTDPEPLPEDHPLYKMPNVIITPHIGGITVEAWRRMSIVAAEEIIRVLSGKPPLHPVNPKVLETSSTR